MSGNGTVGNPYIITDITELQAMQDNLTAYYKLGNDIDASETSGWNGGAGFIPIGNYTDPFQGGFDGAGYNITNLYMNNTTTPVAIYYPEETFDWFDAIGLFGRSNGSIENVNLLNFTYYIYVNDTNASTYGLYLYAGGIAGLGYDAHDYWGNEWWSFGGGYNITDCYVTGRIIIETTDTFYGSRIYLFAGGVAGIGAIEHCGIDVDISTDFVCPLLGRVGGAIGIGYGWHSYSRGDIVIDAPISSGGAGFTPFIVGGFAGYAYDWLTEDIYCPSDECYSTGEVAKDLGYPDHVIKGGLIGDALGWYDEENDICYWGATSCYWDKDTSGQSRSAGGTPKTTSEMKTVSTYLYTGWATDGYCYPDIGELCAGRPIYCWNDPWSFQFVPSALYANPISGSAIALDWAVATSVWSLESGINDGYPALVGLTLGATTKSNVAVFRKMGGYPDNTSDPNATLVYLGTDMSCYDTGLNAGTTYYYRAWGEIDGNYSAGYAEDVATTLVGKKRKANVTTPEAPSWWFREPNCDLYKNLPGAKLGADLADSYDLPHPTACLLFTIFLLIIIGVGAYLITKNALGMMFILSIAIILFSIAGALFGWMLFIGIFLGGSIIYVWSRG